MDFLVVEANRAFRDAICQFRTSECHRVESATSAREALTTLKETEFDAVFLDWGLDGDQGLENLQDILKAHPNLPVIIVTPHGSVKDAVEAMRAGAVDFLEQPINPEYFLNVSTRLKRLHQMGQHIEQLEREVNETRLSCAKPLCDFTTPSMKEVVDLLRRAAPTPASILFLGESGTGKSIAARGVHDASLRADKPFVTVSCPSLSRELLESELFGHVKGSFTGAIADHWGKVKSAEGGTLFLDEIGDLPLDIQPKLLRLLQEREYERLGENCPRQANVRVIAATNRDLKKRVAERAFREDLYFRLNVITVEMPPLRARPEDIVRFAKHYASHFASQYGREIAEFENDVLTLFRRYPWPGNLRELCNVVEHAVLLSESQRITLMDLPSNVQLDNFAAVIPPPAIGAHLTLEHLEENQIRNVLEWVPNLEQAAAILGIDQTTLYRKRKKLGLTHPIKTRENPQQLSEEA